MSTHEADILQPPRLAPARRRVRLLVSSRLSTRLLWLTIGFVMLAEIGVFAPSMARFRLDYLNNKLATAHLVLTALEASEDQIDPVLRDRLLERGGMLGMTAERPNMPARTLGPHMPAQIPRTYDLRTDSVWDLIGDTLAAMFRDEMKAMAVTGVSPSDPNVLVEVVLDEAPLRDAMWDYAKRILLLGLFISIATAAMVYGTLQWLAVHPLRRLTENMIAFREAPEDPHRIIRATGRHDEVGLAERALADMERELREALLQKERLAGVGTAVTKISHDLKNILATAMLESDRLEGIADPEVRRITAGLVRAIDRAVTLSATTLQFAKEGLPEVKARAMTASELVDDIQRIVAEMPVKPELAATIQEEFTFEGDPELLRRAFENLLRNAAEAGATRVEITARKSVDAPIIAVADNGPGLAPKALQNLFVPFAGSTRTTGSGLGLPIAREMLRVQGGDVVLERSSSEGTCFVVRLPV